MKKRGLYAWIFMLFVLFSPPFLALAEGSGLAQVFISRMYHLNSYANEEGSLFFKAIPYEELEGMIKGPGCDVSSGINTDEPVVTVNTESNDDDRDYVILASYSENKIIKSYVDRQIREYTTTKRRSFSQWLARSGKYIGLIKQILREEGLPEELVYLPLIESGFDTRARSHKRAVGPWQFISATAKKYGLKINYWIDERRDPVKSTRAASRYLRDLYDMFGSWPLALAAYNAGEGNVKRALRRTRTNNYWRIIRTGYLKRETRNYVTKFFAAGVIASDPQKYGFQEIQYQEPLRFDEVTITKPASLRFIAKCADTTLKKIRELNPEILRWCTPVDEKSYVIRVPEGRAETFLECFNSAPQSKRMPRVPYIIKKGDTLYEISKKYRIRIREILALNKGIKPKRLRPGRMIYLPSKD
ncbi:MAG: LysM peptidoglycan-binding domain-containing protein [Nitrospirae bacterium]|nr:MAG: LysM peptidoglycan-binding domain-containing protein [Nitrospirota bacterium]